MAGAFIATGRLRLCFGGETTWQTAPTKQNEISNNSAVRTATNHKSTITQLSDASSCTLALRKARTIFRRYRVRTKIRNPAVIIAS